MNSPWTSLATLLLFLLASGFGAFVRPKLSERHRTRETIELLQVTVTMLVSLLKLASTFNGIALASFGGGLSAWSREIVITRRGWLTDAEFLSAMMLCRLLPGANQVNVAVFVGARMRGAPGALAAVLVLITVPFEITRFAWCSPARRCFRLAAAMRSFRRYNSRS